MSGNHECLFQPRLKGEDVLHIKRSAICGSVFAVVLLWGTLAYGQTTAGTILGVVSDESGARLPGVTVTITHLDTGPLRDDGRIRPVSSAGFGFWQLRRKGGTNRVPH